MYREGGKDHLSPDLIDDALKHGIDLDEVIAENHQRIKRSHAQLGDAEAVIARKQCIVRRPLLQRTPCAFYAVQ